MSVLITFIQKAVMQGICMLFGADGEILTEKSGNLNLGVPGMMYMGGIAGLMAAFYYEKLAAHPNGLVGMILSLLAAFLMAAFGGLIFSVLTITLRANQNVAGLALTTFGVGFGNFFGGSLSTLAGRVGQISVAITGDAYRAKIPLLSKIPVIGDIFFNYGFLTYFAIIITLLMAFFLKRTRWGLNLNAVGESPATADAAGINVTLYKYLATVIGGGIAGLGGLGILPGEVLRIPDKEGLKIPHMGWNSIKIKKGARLFKDIPEDSYVYFVHSYYLKAGREEDVTATTEYSALIHASVEHDNVFACQFHPEKSSEIGLKILKNFVEL